MAIITISSVAGDSVTMDESSHLPAGYSYIYKADMRINPEHPPLMKDLAGLPLLFIKGVNFPEQSKSWNQEINGQWEFGSDFLYRSGNNPDKMIFWGRMPMIAILLLLGFYVFMWAKELFGNNIALLSLFLYGFSPTLLAHGRLVTTDVAAAAGAFISTYYFVKFLNNPSKKNIVLSGIFFGLAELLKYSLILLVPFFGLVVIIFSFSKSNNFKDFLKTFWFYFIKSVLIGLIGFILIYIVYLYHVWNYPLEKQLSDTKFILTSFKTRPLADLTSLLAGIPIFRPIAQYLLGLFMVLQRASGGNTSYFMGEISAAGWKNYFPMVYLIKETLSFHILLLFSLLFGIWSLFKKPFWQNTIFRTKKWLKEHLAEFSMFLFVIIYWATSLSSNLNIGVRHLLPVFPFTIVLVAFAILTFVNKGQYSNYKRIVLAFLLIWQAVSVLLVFPHFLAYFNEIAGGAKNGYKFAVDSNLDWGQDLRRLSDWTNEKNIDKIYVDYFGGGNTEYYLKNKFLPWWGSRNPNEMPKGSYLAVSATFLQGGRGKSAPNFDQPTGYYNWLNNYTPVARIGFSIFVYRID